MKILIPSLVWNTLSITPLWLYQEIFKMLTFSQKLGIYFIPFTLWSLRCFYNRSLRFTFACPRGTNNQVGHVSSAEKAVNRHCLISWSSSSFPAAITATTSQHHCCTKSSSSAYHLYHSTFLQAPLHLLLYRSTLQSRKQDLLSTAPPFSDFLCSQSP